MSISAVPVLAGILKQLELESSRVGGLAFRAACWSDAIGWILVGLALSLNEKADSSNFVWTCLIMVTGISAILIGVRSLIEHYQPRPAVSNQMVLIALLVAAGFTQLTSLHVVFGAFLVGTVFASNETIRTNWLNATSWITDRFFCPVFFAIAGMKLLSSDDLAASELSWALGFLVVCVSTKLIPLYVTGRWIGMSNRESQLLGLLLNTRGLMELVVLSVGLSSGIFSPLQYSIFVVVTAVTTLMSTPLCRLVASAPRYR